MRLKCKMSQSSIGFSIGSLFLLLVCLQLCHALKCLKCNTLKGFKDYHSDCRKNTAKGKGVPLDYGMACLRAEVKYRGNAEIVRFGLNSTHASLPTKNATYPMACDPKMVSVTLGGITLNSYTSCEICNDVDLCNSVDSVSTPVKYLSIIGGIISASLVYAQVP